MTNDNYQRHFKVLGKLCRLYDTASATNDAQNALLAAFVDQYADGTPASIAAVRLFPAYTNQWVTYLQGGVAALMEVAKNAATAYLRDTTFIGDLTTTPTSNNIVAVLTALQTEMGAGVDNVTLTTKDATGLVNFFDVLLGTSGTWNTEADSDADYPDSVYVVDAVVE